MPTRPEGVMALSHAPAGRRELLAMAALLAGITATRAHSFLLFHTLAEFFGICVVLTAFVLAWNTRRHIEDRFLLVLGLCAGPIAIISLLHTLSYKGIGVFSGGANLAAELWIALRLLQAATVVAATIPLVTTLPAHWLVVVSTLASAALVAAIFTGLFPDCYIDGQGVTPFKSGAEGVTLAAYAVAAIRFRQDTAPRHPRIRQFGLAFLVVGGLESAAFAVYQDVYGVNNLIGHLLVMLSALLLYTVIAWKGLASPLDVLYARLQGSLKTAERDAVVAMAVADRMADATTWLTPDGRMIYCNRAWTELMGYSLEETRTMTVSDFNPDHPRESWPAHWQALRKAGSLTFEAGLVARDGSRVDVEICANYIAIADQEYNVAIIRDIRGRKEAEARLHRLVDELSRSNTELERFAWIASHDLQEPLRGVVLFSQLLERQLGERIGPAERESLGFIIANARRMRELVHDLLEYSRVPRSLNLSPLSLDALVGNARLCLRDAIAESGATIVLDGDVAFSADPPQMGQVLQNLIANAIKFRQPDRPPMIRIAGERENGEIRVSIRDNGIGVGRDDLEQIFLIFKRLNNSTEILGTGVGLAICRRIIERHGGRIWVESDGHNQGSCFRFTLPAEP